MLNLIKELNKHVCLKIDDIDPSITLITAHNHDKIESVLVYVCPSGIKLRDED